ncbi:gluzincin family metallopeptidase [Sphingomicrobium arenosum]|uniref:hypothetical protein n=1 Tax=Sphingomicrobium arenosum TaxID=2233861 RepID=UPI002240EF2F|nr:hypothetical protein [Sphingomicrobium arenosum]
MSILLAALLLAEPNAPVMSARIEREENRLVATLSLDEPSNVWLFERSAIDWDEEQPWRPRSFEVLTPDVELRHVGHHDVLLSTDGGPVPSEVRIAVTPFTADLQRDYTPVLAFTDGTMAVYSHHFVLAPVADVDTVAAMTMDRDSGPPLRRPYPTVTFCDADGVLVEGVRQRCTSVNEGRYALFGAGEPVRAGPLTALIDEGLPAWMADSSRDTLLAAIDYYTERFGTPVLGNPTALIVWGGATPDRTGFGGSSLDDMLLLRFEGAALQSPEPRWRRALTRHLLHETAHYWIGQQVEYAASSEAWITEGGAEYAAIRAIGDLVSPGAMQAELAGIWQRCGEWLERGPLSTARQRGDGRAYYDCGAVVHHLLDHADSGDRYFAFWAEQLAAMPAPTPYPLARFTTNLETEGLATAASIIRWMNEGPIEDPQRLLAGLAASAGLDVPVAPGDSLSAWIAPSSPTP